VDWGLTVFSFACVAAGIVLAAVFVRQLVVATTVGPTQLEISDHPLLPGETYQLHLSQSGRLRINRLEVELVCEEEATYRQGTNTRTEVRRVFEHSLLRREAIEVRREAPFEARCLFAVPSDAMHSFQAPHNAIKWKVVVRGELVGWPPYQRPFPVVVRPPTEPFPRHERA
jgi:hypothetical protein